MQLSIIVPVYNEAQNIPELYKRLKVVLSTLSPSNEIIFVNDGSTDNSLQVIKNMAAQDGSLKYIDLSRNFGQQVAISAGLDVANGQWIAVMDGDLQDPPELITTMYQRAIQGFDVAYAIRKKRNGEGIFRKLIIKVFYRFLNKTSNIPIPADAGDFRIINRKVLEVLKKMPERHKFLRGQIAWTGLKQIGVEYDRPSRKNGKSGYTYLKLAKLAVDGIVSFSGFPLKIASYTGFVAMLIGFILLLYKGYACFLHNNIYMGWALPAILFIGGIQLICLGIIGEYIHRIGENSMQRPLYVVNESNIS